MKYPHRAYHFFDIHLLHERTPTRTILDKLDKFITLENLTGVDILYYHGDLYDRTVLLSHEDLPFIMDHHIRTLRICQETGTKIRLLHGTPSHDGNQGLIFERIAKTLFPEVDFRYVRDMEIEYIPDFDMTVMYVPDEWASREEMFLQAKRLLDNHQLEQVDFISGHNQFRYQFNETIRDRISTLNEEDWCQFIKHHGFFGHVHKRSQYKKILVGGSFDRLIHGEEEPKGFLETIYHDETHFDVIFHENKEAQVYKTISLPEINYKEENYLDKLTPLIRDAISEETHQPQYIRLKYHDNEVPITDILRYLKVHFPHVTFSQLYKASIKADKDNTEILAQETLKEVIDINRDNLKRLVAEKLEENHPLSKDILKLIDTIMEKL